MFTIRLPNGDTIKLPEEQVAVALIAEYELKAAERESGRKVPHKYPLRSKIDTSAPKTPRWMNWLMLLLSVVQIVSPIDKNRWKGPDVGKAYDCSYITGEVVMDPPGIDFCEHMHHATKVIRARVYRFEQEQRRIPVFVCTAQRHQLTCDTFTLGWDKRVGVVEELSISRQECLAAVNQQLSKYGALKSMGGGKYQTTNVLKYVCVWPHT